MSAGFQPFRRDVAWIDAEEQPIRPLLEWLDFAQGSNWGYALRFGIIEISAADFEFIEHVMTLNSPSPRLRGEGWGEGHAPVEEAPHPA